MGACGWTGGLGGTEKVLARGGGAGACRNVTRGEFNPGTQVSSYLCVCMICVSRTAPYAGGFVADRTLYVSHRFQDVKGDKSDLVEPIATLPPAL